MRLYTVQMAKWRLVAAKQIPLVDTTAKSGLEMFAPDWENVAAYKNGSLSESDYTELYLEKMRQSYRVNRTEWLRFISEPECAIACYCSPGKFCHRLLLKNILERLCAQQGIPFEYAGELTS